MLRPQPRQQPLRHALERARGHGHQHVPSRASSRPRRSSSALSAQRVAARRPRSAPRRGRRSPAAPRRRGGCCGRWERRAPGRPRRRPHGRARRRSAVRRSGCAARKTPPAGAQGSAGAVPPRVFSTAVGWWAKSSTTVTPRPVPSSSRRRLTPWKPAEGGGDLRPRRRPSRRAAAQTARALATLWPPARGSVISTSPASASRTRKRLPSGSSSMPSSGWTSLPGSRP